LFLYSKLKDGTFKNRFILLSEKVPLPPLMILLWFCFFSLMTVLGVPTVSDGTADVVDVVFVTM
jgi:hypothetical protein